MTNELFDYFEEDNFDIEQMTSYFEGNISPKLSYDELKEAGLFFGKIRRRYQIYALLYEGASKLEQSGMEYCTSIIGKLMK